MCSEHILLNYKKALSQTLLSSSFTLTEKDNTEDSHTAESLSSLDPNVFNERKRTASVKTSKCKLVLINGRKLTAC